MKILIDFIEFYLDYYFIIYNYELYKLIDVVDLKKLLMFNFEKLFHYFWLFDYGDLDLLKLQNLSFNSRQNSFVLKDLTIIFMIDNIISLNFYFKLFLFLNMFFVKLIFFKLNSITFWLLPPFYLFVSGLILLFLIKPSDLNMKIWVFSWYLILIVLLYQFFIILLYINFYEAGLLLKVGKLGAFNLPFNLNLTKLACIFMILFSIFITIIFYMDYYNKILLSVKPEFCSVLFFLGFGSSMVFLQNDLFSIFLYFEIISFCIYGLLFLHKRTNTQLHALIRYVLFSLWVSTCYILGIAFYLISNRSSTSLFYFNKNKDDFYQIELFSSIPDPYQLISTKSYNINNLLIQDFELILSIIFLLLYFLFKLGAGPFYTWTIELYNSSSTGSLFIISMVPKLIYFPIMFFFLFYNFIEYALFWSSLLFIIGLLTILIGCFGILLTDKLKEIYAWSSIIHTGNLLLIVSTMSKSTLIFLIFYLVSYFLISFGFLTLIISLRNKNTGRFIKSIYELNNLNKLHANFYVLAIVLLASAAGFTPFLSFFMKFSLLTLLSSYYGIIITILVGLLNIIGSVAYLWMLRNIIGFNLEIFRLRSSDTTYSFVELKLSYAIALMLNSIVLLIIFSFIFFKDFIYLFSFFERPFYNI